MLYISEFIWCQWTKKVLKPLKIPFWSKQIMYLNDDWNTSCVYLTSKIMFLYFKLKNYFSTIQIISNWKFLSQHHANLHKWLELLVRCKILFRNYFWHPHYDDVRLFLNVSKAEYKYVVRSLAVCTFPWWAGKTYYFKWLIPRIRWKRDLKGIHPAGVFTLVCVVTSGETLQAQLTILH